MADTFVQDPNEKYEFLSNPSAGEENAVWLNCSQKDYYLFGQVVPVRIIGPLVPEKSLGYALMSEGGLPIPLDNMEPVVLFDRPASALSWLRTDGSGDQESWMLAWKTAVEAVEAKLPERLKNSLFITE